MEYITIGKYEPLSQEREAELQDSDIIIIIQAKADRRTYLCHFRPSDLSYVRKNPFIRQAGLYRNRFKTTAELEIIHHLFVEQNEARSDERSMTVGSTSASAPANGVAHVSEIRETFTIDVLLHRNLIITVKKLASSLAQKVDTDESKVMV